MDNKYCIFNEKKPCNGCGECEKCDLNPRKKCDNCGKCLEMDGVDTKAIKIDEIYESKKETDEFSNEQNENSEKQCAQCDCTEEGDSAETELLVDEYSENDKEVDVASWEALDETEDFEEDNVVFIDDVEGLSEVLEDDETLSKYTDEEFPGFIRFKTEQYKN